MRNPTIISIAMLFATNPAFAEKTSAAIESTPTAETQLEAKRQAAAEKLTTLQRHVVLNDGTEPPYLNKYWNHKEEGIYVDVLFGQPLFSSTHKYNSGTGWPSFTRPIKEASLSQHTDHKLGTPRTEVRSEESDAHLGHVFPDGPVTHGGKRYCINSASLTFIPRAEMEAKGYGEYLYLFEEEPVTKTDG